MCSKSLNRLYLFYPTSIIGFLICLVTRSPFAHAAVMFNGVLYDASESRGDFGVSSIDPAIRKHFYIEFSGDLRGWLERMLPMNYDYPGVFLWLLGINRRSKVYCFEAAWHALHDAKVVSGRQPSRLSGSDLLTLAARVDDLAARQMISNAEQILDHFGGGDRLDFIALLKSYNGLQVAERIVSMACNQTDCLHVIDACVRLGQSRQHRMHFEEHLYSNAAELRGMARGEMPPSRASPAAV